MANDFLTVGDVSEMVDVPIWKVRRVVDSIADVPRFGLYRAIPRAMLGKVFDELERQGWIEEVETMAK